MATKEQSRQQAARTEAPGAQRAGSRAHKKRGERNRTLGRQGEEAAARFLYRHGYEIIERNWECAAGEADIIALDEHAVVFVEVKTRSNCEKGMPSEAVDAKKRDRYERIAALYLQQSGLTDIAVRFDIISILVISEGRALVRHHINAFSAPSLGCL